ncbi:chemotaxis protein CheD [Desulfospira joergensenii]|uniref:chemotaxis protein CheD n=1 Tax=Desulfospira joergensenii TaxID=53329 RepID=UPI0003B58DAC|nr:chemotaxis protein CheD [Desulfospira joergensenii]
MKELINIRIGEYYASKEKSIISTILGSCVAVCLFDPENRIGGMNHILMPGQPDLGRYDASARYGINAMELLINGVMKLGGNRKKIIAKTFGGANVLPYISEDRAIGQKIVAFVKEFLHEEKIKITSQDFGGNDTRKIYFHTDTGDVFLKRIASMKSKSIVQEEQKRLEKVRRHLEDPGDVTIFTP